MRPWEVGDPGPLRSKMGFVGTVHRVPRGARRLAARSANRHAWDVRPRRLSALVAFAALGIVAPLHASAEARSAGTGDGTVARARLAAGAVGADCTFNGIPLHGKVKVVDAFADIEVKRVDAFPDLKVKVVDAFADRCGEWRFVDAFPDFTIRYVDAFADIEVRHVDAFPGVP